MRTLIVDDSPIIRLLLTRILTAYGECESAKDGQEGLDAYRRSMGENRPFNLVCLDLGLPAIPGATVLREIRALEAESDSQVKARVLVITASSELNIVDALRQQGADGYLVKPIEKRNVTEYLKSFGFLPMAPGATRSANPIQDLEAMCDADAIHASVLARLIKRMAGSIGRQLSDLSLKPAASTSKANL